jgi:hypothetical protein
MELDVVTGIDNGVNGLRGYDLYQSLEESGGADPATQDCNRGRIGGEWRVCLHALILPKKSHNMPRIGTY